jgi:hypothetical protein
MKPQHEGGGGTWSVPEYVMVRSIIRAAERIRFHRPCPHPAEGDIRAQEMAAG